MVSVNEAIKFETVEEFDKEIEEREQLINQMVGSMWPQVLRDEIETLKHRRWLIQLGGKDKTSPPT